MNFRNLSDTEKLILGEALRAAADGPFFPDWEFLTLFGLDRAKVRQIALDWPTITAPAEDAHLAVNNALNNLLSYPHGQSAVWRRWISVEPPELDSLLGRLRS